MTIYDTREVRRLMTPSEHNHQASFFSWLDLFVLPRYPEVHPLFFAVANGVNLAGSQKQKAMQMNKLKAEGFTPGVADTLFLSGRGGYLGLALEFKTPEKQAAKDGGLSENQQEFLQSAHMEGYRAEVAYGADHAEQIVNEYLSRPKTQDMVYAALKAAKAGDLAKVKEILEEVVLAW
jgi:hypothetical protein